MEDLTVKEKKCVRYLAGEMTKEDEVVFEIELSIDNELLNLYNRYKTIWSLYPTQKEYLHQDKSQQKIQSTVQKKPRLIKLYSLAAVVIIALLAGVSVFYFSNQFTYTNVKISNKGERKQFYLPDSSFVVLNAESKLKYKQNFSNPREVWLEGEAFFEVTENKENPFIVHSKDLQVKVLGTSFGINTSLIKQTVSLATGKVNVLLKNTKDEVNLLPNEQLIWNSLNNEIIKTSFDPKKALAWKEEILFLDNMLFSEAIKKINTFYGVTFKIQEKAIENQRITGAFKNQDLQEFITSLEFITNVKVVKKNPEQFLIQASYENR